jgi:hypothetical protein
VGAGTVDPATPLGTRVTIRGEHSILYALGNAGQTILINPVEDVVIVKWAAWTSNAGPDHRGRYTDAAMFATLIDALA